MRKPLWAQQIPHTNPCRQPACPGYRGPRTASSQVTGRHQEPGPAPAVPAAPAAQMSTIAGPRPAVHPGWPRRCSVSRHLTGSHCTDRCWSGCRSAVYTLRNEPPGPGPGPGPGAGEADVTDGGTCRAALPRGWPAVPSVCHCLAWLRPAGLAEWGRRRRSVPATRAGSRPGHSAANWVTCNNASRAASGIGAAPACPGPDTFAAPPLAGAARRLAAPTGQAGANSPAASVKQGRNTMSGRSWSVVHRVTVGKRERNPLMGNMKRSRWTPKWSAGFS